MLILKAKLTMQEIQEIRLSGISNSAKKATMSICKANWIGWLKTRWEIRLDRVVNIRTLNHNVPKIHLRKVVHYLEICTKTKTTRRCKINLNLWKDRNHLSILGQTPDLNLDREAWINHRRKLRRKKSRKIRLNNCWCSLKHQTKI